MQDDLSIAKSLFVTVAQSSGAGRTSSNASRQSDRISARWMEMEREVFKNASASSPTNGVTPKSFGPSSQGHGRRGTRVSGLIRISKRRREAVPIPATSARSASAARLRKPVSISRQLVELATEVRNEGELGRAAPSVRSRQVTNDRHGKE